MQLLKTTGWMLLGAVIGYLSSRLVQWSYHRHAWKAFAFGAGVLAAIAVVVAYDLVCELRGNKRSVSQ